MMDSSLTRFDEQITLKTFSAVQEWANDHDQTLEEFLNAALKALKTQEKEQSHER